jgi:ankyrin repeat protein
LRRAAEAGDLAVLKELLGKQTDIDSRDSSGRTALMLATLRGRADAVAALLAHGADPNAADARGTTPLQAAMAGSEPAVVKVLQRYGAR